MESVYKPQAVVDDHAVALVVERPRQHHHAAISRAHHRSRPRAKIHALVNARELAVEGAPRAEAVGRRGVNRCAKIAGPERLGRARRKHFFFERDLGFDPGQLLRIRRNKLRRNGQRAGEVVRLVNLNAAAQISHAAACSVQRCLDLKGRSARRQLPHPRRRAHTTPADRATKRTQASVPATRLRALRLPARPRESIPANRLRPPRE